MHPSPFSLLITGAVGVLSACGPGDLADNIEQAGPIGGPFAVSRFFSASGFMGDGMEAGHLAAQVNEDCKPRPAGARGNCYRFDYLPGPEKWSGVYWQYPANNWGSQPGRSIASEFEQARFFIAAEYDVLLPEGAGVDATCDGDICRPGLSCQSGRCTLANNGEAGARCLVSGECAGEGQCVAQRCVPAGNGELGDGCGAGQDQLCTSGLRCGVAEDNTLRCLPEGSGDVGASCTSRNECLAGLYCRSGACLPKTLLGPFNFMVGGIAPTKAGLTHSDQIGVSYFATGDRPQPIVGTDWQEFSIDLSRVGDFSSLIGAFMWAVPFPDIDEVSVLGTQPYLADTSRPVHIYLDDLVFE